ncbi:MAG: Gfo/Idh/MocA family protein [bacterium]
MKPLKVGYVGCGFMAQKVHIPNLVSIPDCELIALAEMRTELGKKVQRRYGIPRLYKDHLELSRDPEVEAVCVSAAFDVQGDIARDLLEAGKHVFMEKPMAVTVKQGEAIVEASRRMGARLMVGYMKRYDAGNELVKENLDRFRRTGELGEITFVRNHGFCGNWICNIDTPMETTDEPIPKSQPRKPDWLPENHLKGYIGYLQQYTHNVNLLRWFLDAGDDVKVKYVDLDSDGMTGIVIFDMKGVRATIESGSVSHYRWDEHTQIYFKNGWIKTWAPPLLLKNVPAGVEIYRAGSVQEFSRPIPKGGWTWSYRRELEHFVSCILSGEEFRSSGEDTLTDIRLFEEIYRMHLGIGRG